MSDSKTVAKRDILTPAEVADWLGVTPKYLADWRWRRQGPPFFHVGRMVRYERTAVEKFIAAGRVQTAA